VNNVLKLLAERIKNCLTMWVELNVLSIRINKIDEDNISLMVNCIEDESYVIDIERVKE